MAYSGGIDLEKRLGPENEVLSFPISAVSKSPLLIQPRTGDFFFFFLVFLSFLEPLPQHMEVPRLGVSSEL